jgi:ribosomal subunit interface protein
MKIIIKTKNIQLDKTIEDFINERIGRLEKFIEFCHRKDKWEEIKPSCEFFVEVEKETRHHKKGPHFKAAGWVHLPGRTLRAEAQSEDLRTAIIEIRDEIEQEMKKYKLRKIDLERRGARSIKKRFHLSPDARFRKP